VGNKWHSFLANHSARKFALFIFISTCVGNLLCELGDLLAIKMELSSHYFNIWFLVIGVFGLFSISIALYSRRNHSHNSVMDEINAK
jgi:hypothetical protein